MRARWWLRAGLIVLAAANLVPGFWAYLLPRSFYNDVPTVSADPPFNQHLMSDVGAFFLAQGVVLVAAAIVMEHRLIRAALASFLTFAVLHLVFHATHLTGISRAGATGLVIALALQVALPAVLLVSTWPVALVRPGADAAG